MPIERTKRQTRSLAQTFQYREDSDAVYIEGYFAVFNSPYPGGEAGLWNAPPGGPGK